MERDKKKRSPNYTLEEKQNILSLVEKYKGVIECKRTGAYMIKKKQDAWLAITKQFNSICTTGLRDAGMLKHFYNNIKHRARKISASENKQRYLEYVSTVHENKQHTESPESVTQAFIIDENKQLSVEFMQDNDNVTQAYRIDDNIPIIDETKIKDLKKKWTDEKKNMKTGGGSFNPSMTDADHQILTILDNQRSPDENQYDNAAEYFGETTVEENYDEIKESNPVPQNKRKTVPTLKRNNKISPKTKCMKKSAELLKNIYYKKKIELVFYQKKNELQKFRNEQKLHEKVMLKEDLHIKLLKKQLAKA